MPQNHLQNHSLTSLFDYQISQQELSTYLSQALDLFKKGTKKYFSLSFPIQKVDVLAVLEQNSDKTSFEYYWEKPSDNFSIAAAGEVARIRSTGKNRFSDASRAGKN